MKSLLKIGTLYKLPCLPNFLIPDQGGISMPIEYLSDDQLKDLGEIWTKNLIHHANRRRKQNDQR